MRVVVRTKLVRRTALTTQTLPCPVPPCRGLPASSCLRERTCREPIAAGIPGSPRFSDASPGKTFPTSGINTRTASAETTSAISFHDSHLGKVFVVVTRSRGIAGKLRTRRNRIGNSRDRQPAGPAEPFGGRAQRAGRRIGRFRPAPAALEELRVLAVPALAACFRVSGDAARVRHRVLPDPLEGRRGAFEFPGRHRGPLSQLTISTVRTACAQAAATRSRSGAVAYWHPTWTRMRPFATTYQSTCRSGRSGLLSW